MSGFFNVPQTVNGSSPSTNQNNYSPFGYTTGVCPNQFLQVNPTASLKLTGLVAGASGNQVTIRNTSTDFLLWLEHESASSTAANRFILPNGFPAFLMPGDSITLVYHFTNNRWNVLNWPQQGMAMGLTQWDDMLGVAPAGASVSNAGIFGAGATGTGSIMQATNNLVDTTEKPVGVATLQTGTTSTGRAVIGGDRANAVNSMVPAQGCALSVARVARITADNGTDTYTLVSGFNDAQGGVFTDGVFWEMRWTGAAEEWSQTRFAATVATRVNTGSPTVDGTFVWLVIFINAAWTRADFIWSQDSASFSVASSPSTGFPSNTQLVGWTGAMITKSLGTTNATASCDHCGYRYDGGVRG